MKDERKPQIPAHLADAASRANEAKRLEEKRRQEAIVAAVARRWDRAMNRTFKGIMPTPERHRMLKRSDDLSQKEEA